VVGGWRCAHYQPSFYQKKEEKKAAIMEVLSINEKDKSSLVVIGKVAGVDSKNPSGYGSSIIFHERGVLQRY